MGPPLITARFSAIVRNQTTGLRKKSNVEIIMIKLVKEAAISRGAFVIDNKGNIHDDLFYHGEIINKPEFKNLYNEVLKLAKTKDQVKYYIDNGSSALMDILDNAGLIRGGIWKREAKILYFTINKNKASDGAKTGAIEKIMKYRPTMIYVEDLLSARNDGYFQADEFAGEYL